MDAVDDDALSMLSGFGGGAVSVSGSLGGGGTGGPPPVSFGTGHYAMSVPGSRSESDQGTASGTGSDLRNPIRGRIQAVDYLKLD